MSTVWIPPVLRPRPAATSSSISPGDSSARSSTALVGQYPSLGGQLLTDEGELNRFVNVYVNGQDVRYLDGLETPVGDPTRSGCCRRWPAAEPMAVPWRLDDADHDHHHAHEDLAPHGGRYDDILDAIGHTPMVAIPRMSPEPRPDLREARDDEPDRLGQGPRREVPRRGPRDARAARRGLDHPRADVGQHRHRPRDDRPAQGVSRRARDARQRHERAAPDGGAVRRRGHRLARGAGIERRDRDGEAPRRVGTSGS